MDNQVIFVHVEYDPKSSRVMVRYAGAKEPNLAPLSPENFVNVVSLFAGVDMGKHVGFSGLESK